MENARINDALDFAAISGWESTAIENHSGIVGNMRNFKSDPHLIGDTLQPDLGYCGAVRTAATVVADDPIFGRFCFGGEMRETASTLEIVLRDGVRRRLHVRTGGSQVDLELSGARFVKEKPIA